MNFLDKLAEIERKYDELTAQLSAPDVLTDPARYQKLAKSSSDLRDVVEKFRQWKDVQKGLVGARTLLEESSADPEMKSLAHQEIEELRGKQETIEAELK